MSEKELKQWQELKKDLQEIKDLNNAVYNVNINMIRDARNALAINK